MKSEYFVRNLGNLLTVIISGSIGFSLKYYSALIMTFITAYKFLVLYGSA